MEQLNDTIPGCETWLDDVDSGLPEAAGLAHAGLGCLPERLLHLKIRLSVRYWPDGKLGHIRAKLGQTLKEVMYLGAEELGEPILPPVPSKPLDAFRVRKHHEWSDPIHDLDTPLWLALAKGYSRHFGIEYRLAIQINARWEVAERPQMTPRELLSQFGFQPNEYSLYEPHSKDPLPPDVSIQLRRGQKFEAQKDGKYGSSSLATVSDRLASEIENLGGCGLEATLHDHNGQRYVEVRNVAIPTPPWSQNHADILISIPATYPTGGLDAFYVQANIGHSSGAVPYQQGTSNIVGKEWRLISWHYTLNRPWNTKSDDLSSHVEHCRGFFMTRGVGQ